MKTILLSLILAIVINDCYSQVKTSDAGWFFISHTQKLNTKFDIIADLQLRSADSYKYLNTLLLRGGLKYNFNKKQSAAFGYVYKGDWMHEAAEPDHTLENRLFEQYMYEFKIRHTELTVRTRLEQRFVNSENATDFSQRGRLFISAAIPLVTDTAFTKGLFFGLQNELFLNLYHKELVNGHFFDQNRPYGSLGYRFSKHIDIEAGYMFWFQKETDGDHRNHIFQVMVTTSF